MGHTVVRVQLHFEPGADTLRTSVSVLPLYEEQSNRQMRWVFSRANFPYVMFVRLKNRRLCG